MYNAHPSFIETHCRATVEAMLMEIPVIAPNKINFANQIWNSRSGFLWNKYEECQNYCKFLENNFEARNTIDANFESSVKIRQQLFLLFHYPD